MTHTEPTNDEHKIAPSDCSAAPAGALRELPFELNVAFPNVHFPSFELPKLDIGWPGHLRLELPQPFDGAQAMTMSAELAAAVKRWQDAMRPLAEIGTQLQKRYAVIMAQTAKFAEPLRRIQLVDSQCERLGRRLISAEPQAH